MALAETYGSELLGGAHATRFCELLVPAMIHVPELFQYLRRDI
jgi:hypothetical protein